MTLLNFRAVFLAERVCHHIAMGNLFSVDSACSGQKVSFNKFRKAKLRLFNSSLSAIQVLSARLPLCILHSLLNVSFIALKCVEGHQGRAGFVCGWQQLGKKHMLSRHLNTELSCCLSCGYVPASPVWGLRGRVCFFSFVLVWFFGACYFFLSSFRRSG